MYVLYIIFLHFTSLYQDPEYAEIFFEIKISALDAMAFFFSSWFYLFLEAL